MKKQSGEELFFMSTEDPEDIQVVRTIDEFIYDHLGKRYIDFNAGWCVGNLGWSRKEIQSKMRAAKIPDYIAPGYHYQGWADLAIGIEVSDSKYADRIQQKCLKKGLIFTTQEKTLTLFPPLTGRQAIAEEGWEILEGCL